MFYHADRIIVNDYYRIIVNEYDYKCRAVHDYEHHASFHMYLWWVSLLTPTEKETHTHTHTHTKIEEEEKKKKKMACHNFSVC